MIAFVYLPAFVEEEALRRKFAVFTAGNPRACVDVHVWVFPELSTPLGGL